MAKNYNIQESFLDESWQQSIYKDNDDAPINMLEDGYEENILFLPLDDDMVFPYMNIVLHLKYPEAIETARAACNSGEPVFIFPPSDLLPHDLSQAEPEDVMFTSGVVGYVKECAPLPNGYEQICMVLGPRAMATRLRRCKPFLRGDIDYSFPPKIKKSKKEEAIGQKLDEIYSDLRQVLPEAEQKQLADILAKFPQDSVRRFYFMAQNSPLSIEEKYDVLVIDTLKEQRDHLVELLEIAQRDVKMKAQLQQKTISELGQRQRDEFLRTQMQQIKKELGEDCEDDSELLKARAEQKDWSEAAKNRFVKELHKLERLNPTSPDYAVQYAYLDTYLDLPWNHCDNSDFSIEEVEKVLDRDHYGLEKVKERIVEQMAVLKLRKDTKAPILCLYGPPGVGKTSLGKSVAEALGRKYVRVALGGLHDEAEIRGHRRTYLGSMPGRIISALQKCGTSDPVMVLDEIDKLGADYKGDPSQALLEVLDPEQNCKFHDNYIDEDYDLSKVLFIATANSLSTISSPLLDRMELIEIGGYIEEEKIRIAQDHLIPKDLKEHGLKQNEVVFSDGALHEIINSYTRESGVRRMEKRINEVLRKIARLKASKKKFNKQIDEERVKELLGKPESFNDTYENNDIPGVVTGLAWTQAGGEILFIESSTAPGKEQKLVLTGNLGDVMKESAILALQYVKSNHEKLGIPQEAFEVGTVHVHVPEGAIPKDGPSAGVTIVTSLASTFTGRKVRSHLAMTGEITLRGKVLPVGGIREKILAAKRAGIKTVMLCEKNRKDIEDIKPEYLKGLEFKYVETIDEALDFALL